MSRELVCLKCPLPDCREGDPGCLLNPKHEIGKENNKEIRTPGRPWTIKDTATRIGCSTDWLRKEIRNLKRGRPASLPRFFTVGNRYLWDPMDVETWIVARKQGGAMISE